MNWHWKKWMITGVMVLLLILLWYNRDLLCQSPLKPMHTFEAVSEVCMGVNGDTYIIDQGKKRLTVLNQKREAIRIIEGGSRRDAFYYACRVCDDADGNIYVADIVYGDRGNRIQQERIIKLSPKERCVIFEADYEE
ncbi:MAG: hypothetical protein K2M91_03580, partial [Lachnospiraceae bacterium]|nr:hypothetical protein [Lachnospiraceae bacterium]